MSSALGTALGALRAFETKLDVNANNIANLHTDKFKKSRVELQESSSGGVKVTITQQNTPGISLGVNERTGEERESSNVSLEEEIVEQMVTQYAFKANVLTVKTADEMHKTLLDIIS
jgi:flagellar hook protein FlgE